MVILTFKLLVCHRFVVFVSSTDTHSPDNIGSALVFKSDLFSPFYLFISYTKVLFTSPLPSFSFVLSFIMAAFNLVFDQKLCFKLNVFEFVENLLFLSFHPSSSYLFILAFIFSLSSPSSPSYVCVKVCLQCRERFVSGRHTVQCSTVKANLHSDPVRTVNANDAIACISKHKLQKYH